MNRSFTKEDIKTVNKCMKRCSISLAIGEMKIKAMVRYHYTLSQWLKLKQNKTKKALAIPNSGKDEEKLELSYLADGIAEWPSHSEKPLHSFLQK